MENIKQFNRQVLSKNILAQKSPNPASIVYYVSLFKQSQTGLLYNQRMLVIDDKTFTIFYTKHFKPLHHLLELEKKGNNVIKQRVYIMNTSLVREENIITLTFQKEEDIKTNWIFKFNSSNLAEKWMFLFHELQEKCISKSIKSKDSKSTGISQYNSILSNLKHTTFPHDLDKNQEQFQSIRKGDEKYKKVAVKKVQNSKNL